MKGCPRLLLALVFVSAPCAVLAGATELTDDNFDSLLASSSLPWMIFIGAPWCAPQRAPRNTVTSFASRLSILSSVLRPQMTGGQALM